MSAWLEEGQLSRNLIAALASSGCPSTEYSANAQLRIILFCCGLRLRMLGAMTHDELDFGRTR
jgi:hypothetical protein